MEIILIGASAYIGYALYVCRNNAKFVEAALTSSAAGQAQTLELVSR